VVERRLNFYERETFKEVTAWQGIRKCCEQGWFKARRWGVRPVERDRIRATGKPKLQRALFLRLKKFRIEVTRFKRPCLSWTEY